MGVFIICSIVTTVVVGQLYMILAAGEREFDLEDFEQEQFIKEWKANRE